MHIKVKKKKYPELIYNRNSKKKTDKLLLTAEPTKRREFLSLYKN